ncbi:MAG TPA: polyphosphate polymerase domain-containing protein [Candidatus Choladousia intestinigallinarum]|nr:polyphosphate polymerase domain-containing protein [Candidatus Choladousia intestinigallinarum]
MNNAYRHELKFVISGSLYQELSRVLAAMMERDSHVGSTGSYNIRSLYFDDLYRTAYQEKIDGVEIRRKYRIRIYNYSDSVISLECKHKNGSYIRKEEIPLSREEYERMRNCDYSFLLHKDSPLAGEFFIDARTNLLRPAVIVDYDREPFVHPVGTVRITFDKNLQAISPEDDIFSPQSPGFSVLAPGEMILEVKFTGKLPEKFRRVFKSYALTQCSASKFCLCVDGLEHILNH